MNVTHIRVLKYGFHLSFFLSSIQIEIVNIVKCVKRKNSIMHKSSHFPLLRI
jgi:hypothetical protein